MTSVRQLVERAAAEKDAHRRQVSLVEASLRCRGKRQAGSVRRPSR